MNILVLILSILLNKKYYQIVNKFVIKLFTLIINIMLINPLRPTLALIDIFTK